MLSEPVTEADMTALREVMHGRSITEAQRARLERMDLLSERKPFLKGVSLLTERAKRLLFVIVAALALVTMTACGGYSAIGSLRVDADADAPDGSEDVAEVLPDASADTRGPAHDGGGADAPDVAELPDVADASPVDAPTPPALCCALDFDAGVEACGVQGTWTCSHGGVSPSCLEDPSPCALGDLCTYSDGVSNSTGRVTSCP